MQGRLLFLLATIIGVFSYVIFFIGVTGNISINSIFLTTVLFIGILCFAFLKHPGSLMSLLVQARKNFFYFGMLFLLALINFVGSLGPELGFDALWYHLLIPKLFISMGSIEFIPGSLLYYSVMPKLIDLLYVPALMFSNEITAKIIHFLFGLLAAIVTYKIANLFVNKKLSYLAAVIFYSNLVVGWMSITAYIDLGRAFFASLSIYFFLLYYKFKETRYLYMSSIVVGLEICTKLLGISTLISLSVVLILFTHNFRSSNFLMRLIAYLIIPIIIVTPWLILSIMSTGSIFYPFLTAIYPSNISFNTFNPILIVKDLFQLFLLSADPISPIYFMILPVLIFAIRKMPSDVRMLSMIILLNLAIWVVIPQKNSRFILPYLPAFSALAVWVLSKSENNLRNIIYLFILLTFVVNIIYRGVANFKYLPVIFGFQEKEEFLKNNLNFNYGDYLDVGNNIKNRVGDDKVLVKQIHNLYYIDFPYDHESWANNNEYKYILTQDKLFTEKGYNLVHKDYVTNTYLYEKKK